MPAKDPAKYAREYRLLHPARVRAWDRRSYVENKAGGFVSLDCKWCGEEFTATARGTSGRKRMFCTRLCKDAYKKQAEKEARAAGKPARSCLHCGADMPKTMRSEARFCSAKCNHRAHNLKRGNGRLRPGRRREIERAYILERDGFRCYLCDRRFPAARLTLDHVIPLARGGTHTPENLRAACLSCNCSKRDREMNEQLLLVG